MRDLSQNTVAYLTARTGIIARTLLWVSARNRSSGATETMGLWNGADHQVVEIDGAERLYYGAGTIVGLPRLTAQAGLSVRMHRVVLSALTPEINQLIRGYDVRFAPVQIHRSLYYPEGGGVVDAPHLVFRGYVDGVDLSRGAAGEEASCELTLATSSRNLTRSLPQKKSDATQGLRQGDRFRRYGDVSGSVDIYWGEARVKAEDSK